MSSMEVPPPGSRSNISNIIDRIVRSKNHYDTLGVGKNNNTTTNTNERALKQSYRKLALQLHPDKCHVEGAEDAFKKVSHAYEILNNPESRAHYDRFGSESQAGTGFGGGNGRDPAEFFRDFMSQNPDFCAAWSAGTGGAGARAGADSSEGPEVNRNTLYASAAALAAGKTWWEMHTNKLSYTALRVPFRLLGRVIFAFPAAFMNTMPYSGVAAGSFATYLGARVTRWVGYRFVWFLAFRQVPPSIRPKRWWLGIQIAVLLSGERWLDKVFNTYGGVGAYIAFSLLNRYLCGGSTPLRQPQQPQNPFSSVNFAFQPGRSPGFVHVAQDN